MNFWTNKKVFLTGHTGFKGSWLSLWLQHLGAHVYGYSLAPATTPNLFTQARVAEGMESHLADVRDRALVLKAMREFKPDVVIHMAAQPLVRYSYQNPIETYETNVMGTVHVLDAAMQVDSVRAVVNVTSDKCYENREWLWGYRENEAMGGHDPYSNSKGCSELVTQAYHHSFYAKQGIGLASARAGNVIGGGDWSPDRLIPDLVRACMAKEPVVIRYPHAIRPWQHVLEPLSGYLMLAEKLYHDPEHYAGGWNFGPNNADVQSVEWIVRYFLEAWGDREQRYVVDAVNQPHEAHYLRLDCTKAQTQLGWMPRWSLTETLASIVSWYQQSLLTEDMRAVVMQQLLTFI